MLDARKGRRDLELTEMALCNMLKSWCPRHELNVRPAV